MLQKVALFELALCWIAFGMAFSGPRKLAAPQKKIARAPGWKWGLILEMIGVALVWIRLRPIGFEKSAPALIVSMILGPMGVALAWWATRHLGKQWRYEAALIEGHQLIQTGPYKLVRHPIYTSLLLMFLTVGAAWSWWPTFIAGLVFFLMGNEIRVRAEDRLLAGRFGDSFTNYKSRVRAYIPFVR